MKGKFVANRITTKYNTINKKITYIEEKIKYEIIKVAEHQYLMKQFGPSVGQVIDILFVKNDKGYISSSDSEGIDNLYFDKNNNLIHSWTDKINSQGVLTNAYAVLFQV